MEEIQKLRAAGKEDEAEKKMAEMKKQMEGIRSRMSRDGDRSSGPGFRGGPDSERRPSPGGGDRRPPMEEADRKKESESPQKKPETAKSTPHDHGHRGPDREDLAERKEQFGEKMREIMKLKAAGKTEEATRQWEAMRKHFGAMRPPMKPGTHLRGGPSAWAKPGGESKAEHSKARDEKKEKPGKEDARKKSHGKSSKEKGKSKDKDKSKGKADRKKDGRKHAQSRKRSDHRGRTVSRWQRNHGPGARWSPRQSHGPQFRAGSSFFAKRMLLRRAAAMKRAGGSSWKGAPTRRFSHRGPGGPFAGKGAEHSKSSRERSESDRHHRGHRDSDHHRGGDRDEHDHKGKDRDEGKSSHSHHGGKKKDSDD